MSEVFAKPWKLSDAATALLDDFSDVPATVVSAISAIEQTVLKTDLMAIFDDVVPDLLAYEADRRVLLIVSDGEHTVDADKQAILDAATTFKQGGGIIIVVGVRASGSGFDLLERIATGGYFINAIPSTANESIQLLNYLKSLICAGDCAVNGDTFENLPSLLYSSFLNFEVVQGQVNLLGPGLLDFLPGNGLYVELAANSTKGLIRTIDPISIVAGRTYRINFALAGNQRVSLAGQGVKVFVREVGANDADPNIFEQVVFPSYDADFQEQSFSFIPLADASVRLNFEQLGTDAAPSAGNLLDHVRFEDVSTLTMILHDDFGEENSTYVGPNCGPSAALQQLEAPEAATAVRIFEGATPLAGDEIYNLGISYVTLTGETPVSALLQYTAENEEDTFRVTIPLPTDDRVTAIRVWRSLGATPVETDLFLLDTIPVNQSVYLDAERRAEFEARYDDSTTVPTVNTTAVNEGALGFGYADCCYYDVEEGTEVANPPCGPTLFGAEPVTDPDGEMIVPSDGGFYFITYVTAEGETSTNTCAAMGEIQMEAEGNAMRIFWPAITDPRITKVRIYRGNADFYVVNSSNPNFPTANPYMRLLAEVEPTETEYIDIVSINDVLNETIAWIGDSTAPTTNTTVASVPTYDNRCPSCADEPPGVQSPDPSPLPDIESGYTPPVNYSSTKTHCATCGDDQQNESAENLVPAMTSATAPSGVVTSSGGTPATGFEAWRAFDRLTTTWMDLVGTVSGVLGYQFTAAQIITRYVIKARPDYVLGTPKSWTFQGSNNGSTWTTLDTRTNVTWFPGESKSFAVTNSTGYTYYRLNITDNASSNPTSNLSLAEFEMYGSAASQQVCRTATETSFVSQGDADAKAMEAARSAAEAALNCVGLFTATESFTAVCPFNQYGSSVTRSATRTSYVSQADAEQQAAAAAQALAEAALDCELSNNDQQITINDNTKATPYGSIKFVEGLTGLITKVTVSLNNWTHPSPDDVQMLLVAPDGQTAVRILAKVGGVPPNAVSGVNLVLDQDAASPLPDSTQIVSGTFRPAQYGVNGDFPLPVPASISPYGTSLNDFIGLDPNGSWGLYIVDTLSVFDGSLGSWDLSLTTA